MYMWVAWELDDGVRSWWDASSAFGIGAQMEHHNTGAWNIDIIFWIWFHISGDTVTPLVLVSGILIFFADIVGILIGVLIELMICDQQRQAWELWLVDKFRAGCQVGLALGLMCKSVTNGVRVWSAERYTAYLLEWKGLHAILRF